MPRYLITGGAGFIGSNLLLSLLKDGNFVRVLDNFSSGISYRELDQLVSTYPGHAEIINGDIRELDSCKKAVEGITHVLHHASIASALVSIDDPVTTMAVNVLGTANILSAARDSGTVERFVNASSCAVYGDGSSSAKTESSMLFPGSPFATSMQAAESLCTNFFKSYGLCTTTVRYFNVYGESELNYHPRSAVSRFIHTALQAKDINIYGSGSQTRDYIHIDDAVSAVKLISEADEKVVAGQVFNIGTGHRATVLDILNIIADHSGWPLDCVRTDPPQHEMMHSKADIVKAQTVLGFHPKISIESGIRQMIALASVNKRAA